MIESGLSYLLLNLKQKGLCVTLWNNAVIKQAKEIESKERIKNQIFIGKVTEIIGFDKTLELLRESKEAIK